MLVFGSSGAVPGLNDRNTRKLRTQKSEVEAGKVKGRHRPYTLSPTSANTTPEGKLETNYKNRDPFQNLPYKETGSREGFKTI